MPRMIGLPPKMAGFTVILSNSSFSLMAVSLSVSPRHSVSVPKSQAERGQTTVSVAPELRPSQVKFYGQIFFPSTGLVPVEAGMVNAELGV